MFSKAKAFLSDVLISHGWQLPVRIFSSYQDFVSRYSSMSQERQDLIALELLGYKRNGMFVDLGASNGVTSSNTYLLEKEYGWNGLCIEANQFFYKHLVKNRKCQTFKGVVAGSEIKVHFNNDGVTGSIDSVGEEMDAHTLEKILLDHNMPKTIDYLSLDVEGYEEEVLYDFLSSEFRFRVMSIERPSDRLHDKILESGYELYKEIWPWEGFLLDKIYVYRPLL